MRNERMPVLVGAGQYTQKDVAPEQALPPMGIAAEAARAAIAAAGAGARLAAAIDTIVVIRTFSDSTPRRSHGHGRATNPPRSIARDIGADPKHAVYSEAGGEIPQRYVSDCAERILKAEAEVVLLAGGEAIATEKAARRSGITLSWQDEVEGQLDDRGFGTLWFTPRGVAHGIGIPIQTYPLFEQAVRAKRGADVSAHLRSMGRLLSPFSAVAAANPFAYFRTSRSAEEIATPSTENPFIGFPYTRYMNARDAVDQGAALIMTSVGKAKALGIAEENLVFLHGCSELDEKLKMSDRVDYASSPAIAAASRQALDMAGIDIDDIRFFDLYSCFPSAVEIAAEALGITEDDSRGLTLTGGLPFFGGPGNNYTMHGIAEAWQRCREHPGEYALVTGNGGTLTKHAIGIYSTRVPQSDWRRPTSDELQRHIDAMESPPVDDKPDGAATVDTYTVIHDRDGPTKGIVIGRLTDSGARFVANTPEDRELLDAMLREDFMGAAGTVISGDPINRFRPD